MKKSMIVGEFLKLVRGSILKRSRKRATPVPIPALAHSLIRRLAD
jgi:hypothetical protein